MNNLKKQLQNGAFVITGEIDPPKGTDLSRCLQNAREMSEYVTSFNVTDLQSAIMRIGSLAVSAKLVEQGLEPVYQLTCRDRNRLALQSDVLSAWALGIENVLCLTGDHPALGDHTEAKAVYDLDSVQLLKAVNTLNQGYDLAGHDLESHPNFYVGAVVTPTAEPLELQIIKMKKKVEAGAEFFQTQAVYDPEKFEDFMNRVQGFKVPVIAGIVVVKSGAMARYINENVAGISVPQEIIQEMEQTAGEDRKRKAVEIAARTIRRIRPLCQGVHLMPQGWDEIVPDIIREAGISERVTANKIVHSH